VAQLLAQHYRSLDELAKTSREELEDVEGLGPRTAGAVVEWFAHPRNQDFIETLRRKEVKLKHEVLVMPAEGPLAGQTFVITGTLSSMSREEATQLIERHGGKVTGSVSNKTDYLVVGGAPGGSKYRKARQLEVPMIDEARLLRMIGQGQGSAVDEMDSQG